MKVERPTLRVEAVNASLDPALSDAIKCYQCKKCSCGCPLSFAMDTLPHQTMRHVQLRNIDELYQANTHWICSSCQTCTTRCPNEIDIARLMDLIRQTSPDSYAKPEAKTRIFHRVFLSTIQRRGRLHELSLIANFKLRSRDIFRDIPMGLGMLVRKKLRLFPGGKPNRAEMRRLFTSRTR